MNLKEKIINFLGDSITEGYGASVPQKCFVKQIEEETGAICNNYGIGGTRIAKQIKSSKEKEFDKDFCSRIDSMDVNADIIAVFGGTNDFGHGDAPIGNLNDQTPDSFYGALNFLYKNLIIKYPDAFIFVITPLHRIDENNLKGDGSKEKNSLPLREYVKIIREVADNYSLPILDLFANSGINPSIPTHEEKYTIDGLHPNDLGHQIISQRIIKFINENI